MRVVRSGFLVLAWLVCSTVVAAPVDVIFDTDMGNDVDDVLALGLIHALESRGECRLLAVTIKKDEPIAAAFTDAVNTFYGRPDGSVVIAQVGFSTNLARLLDTPPGDVSPLSGRDLAARKVRLVSVMGGAFAPIEGNRCGEYNLVNDIASAKKVASQWPTPILWSGYEIGLAMPYPAASIEQDYRWVAHHPLVESYVAYEPPPHARPTWDLTSVLAVVRPDRDYFGISQPGRVIVEDDGRTRFEPAADGPHRHLLASPEQAARVTELFAALCSQPPPDR
jgi:inosine-uridine nucleoside N-ribohydrolase